MGTFFWPSNPAKVRMLPYYKLNRFFAAFEGDKGNVFDFGLKCKGGSEKTYLVEARSIIDNISLLAADVNI